MYIVCVRSNHVYPCESRKAEANRWRWKGLIKELGNAPKLLGQLHIKLAIHRPELGLRCQVSVLFKARVAGNMPWQLLRVLDDARNRRVDFLGHFVQEVGNLNKKSVSMLKITTRVFWKEGTYRLDKPTSTTKFEPAEVATPRRGQHDTVGGLSHFVEWQCVAGCNLNSC